MTLAKPPYFPHLHALVCRTRAVSFKTHVLLEERRWFKTCECPTEIRRGEAACKGHPAIQCTGPVQGVWLLREPSTSLETSFCLRKKRGAFKNSCIIVEPSLWEECSRLQDEVCVFWAIKKKKERKKRRRKKEERKKICK